MATTMGVKLDDSIRERLKKLGKIKHRAPHWLMKTAIQKYLDREEAYEAEKCEDMRRWEEYHHTGHHLTNDQMMDWLDELEV